MTSVIDEIRKLRPAADRELDIGFCTRHMINVQELGHKQTAYCFSVPVCRGDAPVALEFNYTNTHVTLYGPGSKIIIKEDILFENDFGTTNLYAPWISYMRTKSKVYMRLADNLNGENAVIEPTVNGLAVKVPVQEKGEFAFRMRCDTPKCSVRCNDKYVAFMRDKFNPNITVSCIGALDRDGSLIAPCKISCKKQNDKEYIITVSSMSDSGKYVFFEMNMHEPKFFLDTTVESKNTKAVNTFGGVAFVGKSEFFGETWLYTRPNFSQLSKLNYKNILNATLYIPNLSRSKLLLSASPVSQYFCSFNSTWENKVFPLDLATEMKSGAEYYKLDITSYVNQSAEGVTAANGLVIKAKSKRSGFAAISTGDNYYAPQILEIKYY